MMVRHPCGLARGDKKERRRMFVHGFVAGVEEAARHPMMTTMTMMREALFCYRVGKRTGFRSMMWLRVTIDGKSIVDNVCCCCYFACVGGNYFV